MLVGRGDAGAGVDHEQHQVGLRHGGLGARPHPPVERLGIALLQPGGVDQLHGSAAQQRLGLFAVARHPRRVGHDRLAAADQLVEQGRLADIGPAGDDDGR